MPLNEDDVEVAKVSASMLDAAFHAKRFMLVYPTFRIEVTKKLLDDIMLKAIKTEMRKNKFSKKIIDSTYIRIDGVDTATGDVLYTIVSDYKVESKYGKYDVSEGREYGTSRHWIAPLYAKVLHWLSGGPQSGRSRVAIFAKRHDNKKGSDKFSKGHYVSGIIGLKIIQRARERLEPKVQKEMNKRTAVLLSEVYADRPTHGHGGGR